jgi:hypothetical protein
MDAIFLNPLGFLCKGTYDFIFIRHVLPLPLLRRLHRLTTNFIAVFQHNLYAYLIVQTSDMSVYLLFIALMKTGRQAAYRK